MKTGRKGRSVLWFWVLCLYVMLILYNHYWGKGQVWITNRWLVELPAQAWLMALLQLAGITAVFAAFAATIRACGRVLRQRRPFLYFGLFFLLLGGAGLLAFFTQMPKSQISQNLHVVVVGAFIFILGVVMIFKKPGATTKNKEPRRERHGSNSYNSKP